MKGGDGFQRAWLVQSWATPSAYVPSCDTSPCDGPWLAVAGAQEEIVAWVRRRSSAFSRGRSRFRGVSGQQGRWEARIGTFAGRKNVLPPRMP